MTAIPLRCAFKKKINVFSFHAVVDTHENLSIDVSITTVYCRTDIDEAMPISFLEVQTDEQTRFRNPHMEICLTHKKIQIKA